MAVLCRRIVRLVDMVACEAKLACKIAEHCEVVNSELDCMACKDPLSTSSYCSFR